MRYLLVVLFVVAACRVEGSDGDGDADADAWSETDADAEGGAGCPSACGEVDCSGRGACDMDLSDCTPYCWCWIGYHQSGDGLACLPD